MGTIVDSLFHLFLPLHHCVLKALYTFGNCQRPVFSLGVSHHKHKNVKQSCENWPHLSSKLRENDERKNTLVGRICVLSDRKKRLEVLYYFSEKLPLSQKIQYF